MKTTKLNWAGLITGIILGVILYFVMFLLVFKNWTIFP
jgi:hypothetical protein